MGNFLNAFVICGNNHSSSAAFFGIFISVLNAIIINVILSVTLVPCEVVFIEAWSLVLCCIVSLAEVVLKRKYTT
jgi:hypothetical protein